MTTLNSPRYAKPDSLEYQMHKKQQNRKQRNKSQPPIERFFRRNEGTTDFISIPLVSVDRIVMSVDPVTDNTGLPTGAPAVTAGVLQTIDFVFAGSLDEIGRNGASFFEGIIADVDLYFSGSLIRSYAIDDNSDTIKDSAGGFDGTVINGNNDDWSKFFRDGNDWVRDAILYPGVDNLSPNPFNPGLWTTDPDGSITNLKVANPSGFDFAGAAEQLVGGTDFFLNQVGSGFGVDTVIGDKVYQCILAKNINYDGAIRFRFFDSTGFISDTSVSIMDGSLVSGSALGISFTKLNNDYNLIQIEKVTTANHTDIRSVNIMWDAATNNRPVAGSIINVQAVFFGTSSDFPAETEERLIGV